MKKSTLLSFATAAAIVVTSAGTFAAWDQTTAKSGVVNVEIGKKVTMTIADPKFKAATERTELVTDNALPAMTEQMIVNVNDVPTSALNNYELQITSTIKKGGVEVVDNSIKVEAIENEPLKAGEQGVDEHVIEVTVTPTAETTVGNYTIELTAELIKKV